MKVVLFCGGLGLRLRDAADGVPKPMICIGYRPILWHVMKYYAHFGHKDFILCLGYRGDSIKEYFLNYNECVSNDFVLGGGGKAPQLLNRDIDDWRITFVDTGMNANIGQRLKAVQPYLDGESEFLANYSDGLTDLPLPALIDDFHAQDKVASFVAVRPNLSYHVVSLCDGHVVADIANISDSPLRINGGYFVFKRDIFDLLQDGEELVQEPFRRLMARRQLMAFAYDGFWQSMDTFKDRQQLDELYAAGHAPWELWRRNGNGRKA